MKKVRQFLSEVRIELAKVSWPSPRQTLNLTLIVVLVSLIVGVYVGAIDLVMAQLVGKFLK